MSMFKSLCFKSSFFDWKINIYKDRIYNIEHLKEKSVYKIYDNDQYVCALVDVDFIKYFYTKEQMRDRILKNLLK